MCVGGGGLRQVEGHADPNLRHAIVLSLPVPPSPLVPHLQGDMASLNSSLNASLPPSMLVVRPVQRGRVQRGRVQRAW